MKIRWMRASVLMLLMGWSLTGAMCTKVIAYGQQNQTNPLSKTYGTSPEWIFQRSEEALKTLGYEIQAREDYQWTLTTGWQSVPAGAFYLRLFDREDYAASSGAYYQVVLKVNGDGAKAKVDVSTNVKSMAGKLESKGVVEEKILKLLSDYLRSPQIQMTNVGVEERS